MKTKKEVVVDNIGELKGHDFKIDVSNTSFITNLFSKNFYSNPKAVMIREYLSNCWDSHIKAKRENIAIQLRIFKDNGQWYISFDDFGTGLSPKQIKNIYSVFFSSDKRDSNDFIGAMGLGSKSAYAYTDTFYVNTWYNNTLYKYLMCKNEHDVPRIELLATEKTKRRNGTSVIIPIKNNSDLYEFKRNIPIEAAYFNNLIIDTDDSELNDIMNNSKIYQGKYFSYNPSCTRSRLHLLNGQVPYKFDHNAANMGNYSILPIAVKFDIGELEPNPQRESIKYTPKAIKFIKERIKKACDELVEIYNKNFAETDSLDTYESDKNNKFIYFDDYGLNINGIEKFSTITPKVFIYKPLRQSIIKKYYSKTLPSYIFENLDFSKRVIDGYMRSRKSKKTLLNYEVVDILKKNVLFSYDTKSSVKINKYLNEKYPDKEIILVRKRDMEQISFKSYYKEEDYKLIEKEITDYVDKFYNDLPSYSDIIIPKTFVAPKPTFVKRIIDPKYISYKYFNWGDGLIRGFRKNKCLFFDFSKDSSQLYVYGRHTENIKIKKFEYYGLVSNNIELITINKNDIKRVEDLKNTIHIDDFTEDHQYIRDTHTAIAIHEFIKNYGHIEKNTKFIFDYLKDNDLEVTYNELREFKKKYNIWSLEGYPTNFYYRKMYEYALEKNLFNIELKNKLDNFIEKTKPFDFLKHLKYNVDGSNKEFVLEILKSKI